MWIAVIAVIIVLAIVAPVIIFHARETQRRYQEYTNGVMNHDASFREFVYKVDKSGDEIWEVLKRHNTNTATKYRFHETDGTIVFYSELPGSVDITYRIQVLEHEGYSVLKVVQQNYFWEKNKYMLLQNEFWNQLLGATPIPYIQQPM